jgi:hypothetical protein
MPILVVLLTILILAAVVFHGLLGFLRETLEDSPYAAPVAPVADSMRPAAAMSPSKDAQHRSCG